MPSTRATFSAVGMLRGSLSSAEVVMASRTVEDDSSTSEGEEEGWGQGALISGNQQRVAADRMAKDGSGMSAKSTGMIDREAGMMRSPKQSGKGEAASGRGEAGACHTRPAQPACTHLAAAHSS